MSRPARPLRELLPVSVDAAMGDRMWRKVAERRARLERGAHRLSFAGAFALGVTAAVLVLVVRPMSTHEVTTRPSSPEVLALRGGGTWTEATTAGDREQILELDDGSRIALEPGSRLAPLENTGRSVALLLQSGRVHFFVQPGGPRRWSIEAGLATIEVIGTAFVVTRSPSQVTIEVEHGTVLVRGERVVDRVQRLQAGDRLEITEEVPPAASSPPAAAPPAEPRADRNPRIRQEPAWRDLARRGDYEQAYRNLGADGIATQVKTADVDQLLALADVARLSGHPSEAVGPLRRVVNEFGSEPRGALAAFTLGRVHLDSLDDPRAAAQDFRDAISLGLSKALLEDAYLRLIESSARAGDLSSVERSCRSHFQLFPDSTRRATAARWCQR